MIKLEMELSDIDYEVLVKEILPKVADRLKRTAARSRRSSPAAWRQTFCCAPPTACATAWPRRSSTPPRRA